MNNWISVDEKLPEECTPVLVTQHAYLDPTQRRYIEIAEHREDCWTVSGADGPVENGDCFRPSHWMPLPEPPKN